MNRVVASGIVIAWALVACTVPDAEFCGAECDVAYVVPVGGVANPACSQAMPCASLTQALASGKGEIVVAEGEYAESATIVIDRDVVIRAAGAAFSQAGGAGPVLEVRGTGQVTIVGGAFDGTGDGAAAVIAQTAAGNTLTLDGVLVRGSAGHGITSLGRLAVRRSTIRDNAELGILAGAGAVGGDFALISSTIVLNRGGGVRVSATLTTMINNVVARNGSPGNSTAAVYIANADAGSRFEFNTVANNVHDPDAFTGGIDCGSQDIPIVGSIIHGNQGLNQEARCAGRYSIIQGAPPPPGDANGLVDVTPMFIDPANNDFGLRPGSPGVGLADPNANLAEDAALDRDGEPRPQPAGTRADVGADEIP